MSLDFSLDVHMSSYNKLKEELSIYEMYTLLMAGKKTIPLHCIEFVNFIYFISLLFLLLSYRETTVVSLWNQHAQSFDADRYMEMASHAPVAFLFVGMTCRIFEGIHSHPFY